MFSEKIIKNLNNSSWIRIMFAEGAKITKQYGADNVYDYSLGNPIDEPPIETTESLKKYILSEEPGLHRYMSNSGFPDVREKIAKNVQEESGVSLTQENIIMTVGAAGGLNVVFKSILNEGEEVIIFSPYFWEYNSYVDNNGGKIVFVDSDMSTFQPDLKKFEESITSKTKAVIINSPNNPTGVVYGEECLKSMAAIIESKEKEYESTIFIVSDEPYSKILFDGINIPSLLRIFKNAIKVDSFSKTLGLAGERIGYIAASSNIQNIDTLMKALEYCNRTLGFVNAPALFQKVIGDSLNAKVNVEAYEAKRDFLYDNLTRLGFECVKPQGAFYLFPKTLIPDDVEFCKRAVNHKLLLVPGSGFGCPGYMRLSYSGEFEMIKKSISAFEALAKEFK